MEKQPKRRIPVKVAGNTLSLVTDEPDELVKVIVGSLNHRFADLRRSHFLASDLDVALLCAIDYMGDALRLQRKLDEMGAELIRLRKENDTLRTDAEKVAAAATEEKIRAFEDYVAERKASAQPDPSAPADGELSPEERAKRDKKIAAIEALLRGNDPS